MSAEEKVTVALPVETARKFTEMVKGMAASANETLDAFKKRGDEVLFGMMAAMGTDEETISIDEG